MWADFICPHIKKYGVISVAAKTKLKLLYIKDYLEKYSDENNPVSADELLEMLSEKGIACERKSIYSDVQALRDYGADIFRVRVPKNGYYIGTREFELPEVRLLTDAVLAADFITSRKSKDLLTKIGTLCSEDQLRKITGQVYINSNVKCDNEEIYYNIDVISRAVEEGKKIIFNYLRRKVNSETGEITSSSKKFTVSPYAMIWSDDHYYLVGNNSKYDNLMHVRIDRMKKVTLTEEKSRPFSEVCDYRSKFDAADYSQRLFNMFSGELQEIELECENTILEEILDRFGKCIAFSKSASNERFRVLVKVAVSEGLVAWLLQYGRKVEIISPENLRESVREKAEEIISMYS